MGPAEGVSSYQPQPVSERTHRSGSSSGSGSGSRFSTAPRAPPQRRALAIPLAAGWPLPGPITCSRSPRRGPGHMFPSAATARSSQRLDTQLRITTWRPSAASAGRTVRTGRGNWAGCWYMSMRSESRGEERCPQLRVCEKSLFFILAVFS